MNTRKTIAAITATLALAAGSLGLTAGPSLGADNVTINASVSVAAAAVPCITSSGSYDFGSNVAFSQAGAANQVTLAGGTVNLSTACATVPQNILVRSTAFGNGIGGASWALTNDQTDICTGGVNRTTLRISNIPVANADTQFASSIGPNTTVPAPATLRMPCAGSSGAGTTMNATVTVTAVIS